MASAAVRFKGDYTFDKPHTAGQKFYFRSTDVDDDGGFNVGGDNTSDVMSGEGLSPATGEGTVETLSANAYNTVEYFHLNTGTLEGVVSIYSNDGTAATGWVHIHALPSDGDTLIFGVTGFTETITWKTTVASTGQVKIGSTVSECADNLASFLNDTSTGTSTPVDLTDWSATAANAYVSATVSGSNVTLTDLIKCNRQNGWTMTPTDAADVVVNNMSGGADGTLLGTMSAGSSLSISTAAGIALDATSASEDTLPGELEGTTQAVRVGGRFAVAIEFFDTPGSTLDITIQLSADGSVWRNASTSITDISTPALKQWIVADELFTEWARLSISNDNSTSLAGAIHFITQS